MKALSIGLAILLSTGTVAYAQSSTTSRPQSASTDGMTPPATATRTARVMMLRWFTSDVIRAEKFYQAVFGMTTVQKMGEKVRILMFPGGALPGMILVQSDQPTRLKGSFVAQVTDVNATLAAAAANGATLLNTRFGQEVEGQQARSSHFEDPDGNVVEVLQLTPSKRAP